MKQVSPELLQYLHSRTEFFMCDLYEITLQSGLTFRYANYDMDITLPTGGFFSCKGPQFKRDRTKLSSTIEVDKMNVTVGIDQTDTIDGVPMIHIAHNGGFDEATFTLLRCFMDTPGVVVGAVEMFTGYVDIKDGGGLSMKWEIKSSVQRLNVDYPLRKYYPTCPFSIYDASCGLNLTNVLTIGTVTAVTSQQVFSTNLMFADEYYDQGGIEWLTGPLAGAAVAIKKSYNSAGTLVMLLPMETVPMPGNTFRAYPGCDKTPKTCKNKFGNFLRNRATPYVPLKEAIM